MSDALQAVTVSIQVSFMAVPYFSKLLWGASTDTRAGTSVGSSVTSVSNINNIWILTCLAGLYSSVAIKEGYFAHLGIEPTTIMVSANRRKANG